MASTTVTVISYPGLAGTTITAKAAVASSQTVTIAASTAQGCLDFGSLVVRVYNQSSTASVTVTLGAGTVFNAKGIGAAAAVTVATEGTTIIGGQLFEGSRFLITAQTIVFTQAGTGPTSWEAYQAPRASE
jgi:hypothetical protein